MKPLNAGRKLFNGPQRFNCAQSVFTPYAKQAGLPTDLALKLSTGLGGGLGHSGELCGAVSGGILAIGLAAGRAAPDDIAARDRCYALTHAFVAAFKEKHGAIRCEDLLGQRLDTAEGRQLARDLGLHDLRCKFYVESAFDIVDTLLETPASDDAKPKP